MSCRKTQVPRIHENVVSMNNWEIYTRGDCHTEGKATDVVYILYGVYGQHSHRSGGHRKCLLRLSQVENTEDLANLPLVQGLIRRGEAGTLRYLMLR